MNTESYIQQVVITVPADAKWEAKFATQLISGAFNFYDPFVFRIHAAKRMIIWAADLPEHNIKPFTQLVYGLYPNAQIAIKPKRHGAGGYYNFSYHTRNPFVLPIEFADDLDVDPLAIVTSAMGSIEEDEAVIFELSLDLVREKVIEIGEKLLDDYINSAASDRQAGRIPWFSERDQRLANHKLSNILKETSVAFKIKADSRERAFELMNIIHPTRSIFAGKSHNSFVAPGTETFSAVLCAEEVAALWHFPSDQCQHPFIKRTTSRVGALPISSKNIQDAVLIGRNTFQGRSDDVYLKYKDRIEHMNIIGRTNQGKTTLMHNIIHQDIKAGHGVGVIDPHGDLIEEILKSSIPKEREKDVVLFDVMDQDFPIGLNLLAPTPGVSASDIASQTLSVIKKIFADDWSATRMEDTIYACLSTLTEVGGFNLLDITRLLSNDEFRNSIVSQLTDPISLDFWQYTFEPMKPGQKIETTRPITNRIRAFYRSQNMRRIMAQSNSLDFQNILNNKKIFLAKLSGIADNELEILGTLLMAKFQIATLSRSGIPDNERVPFYLHVDEVQKFVTTKLSVMFSEARKFGVSLNVANQYTSQLEGDTLDAILGNIGAIVMFAAGDKDATRLAPYAKPNFSADDLLNLNQHQAIVKMQNNGKSLPAFTMSTFGPVQAQDGWEEQVINIRKHSQQAYGKAQAEVDQEILDRYKAANTKPSQDVDAPTKGYHG